ncbi:hypothetical protein [Nocardia bovistercoris]|uniref:Uncharacterized protein n=1 Tax=Nocardia bovistercoris TaxID=2785916 RepID=A0A931N5E0_9NOCA|nr:hypothetical protein [Nocardia bovistercoris]MBH0779734.1 hypothetical protein [Nocardia bovistercoris]
MVKGILLVESEPRSAEDADAYHRWYDEIHMKEMLGIEGLVAARRFAPVTGEGVFVAVYEIEADDIAHVQARLAEITKAGGFSAPVGLRTDPPPTVRFYRDISAHTA